MPNLNYVLQEQDITYLKQVAQKWGLELESISKDEAIAEFISQIREAGTIKVYIEELPPEAKKAFSTLLQNKGRLPWQQFTRSFGEMRLMGAARRDRERPDINPVSPVEYLWYRALVASAFLDVTQEPSEYAYIPDEIMNALNPKPPDEELIHGRQALPQEHAYILPVNDRILDHACTVLASLRCGTTIPENDVTHWNIPYPVLFNLLSSLGYFDEMKQLNSNKVQIVLEAEPGAALLMLFKEWSESITFDDLRQLPGLIFEGEWKNDPLKTRRMLLDLINRIPPDTWWSLPSFINSMHQKQPDYLRSGGEYESWYIRKAGTTEYLKGFSCWQEVEGEYLRFIICCLMHPLGLLDLASLAEGSPPTAFRLSKWAQALLKCEAPHLNKETDTIRARSDGNLYLSPQVPLAVRYQITRFCEWESAKKEYFYCITPASLRRAHSQGLSARHLLALLQKHVHGEIPPSLIKALTRWDKNESQAIVERKIILKVTTPEMLKALQKTNAARFLGDTLNERTIIIKEGGTRHVQRAMAELGFLADISEI